jgi:hypothetical protein
MRKIQTITLALVAVLAFSAVAAASASAAKPEWLIAGKALIAKEPSATKGKVKLVHTGGITGSTTVECDGEFTGTIGPGKEDTITAATDLTGKSPVDCTVLVGNAFFCAAGSLALVTAIHLPWKTELLEPVAGEIRDDILNSGAGEPGYKVVCNGVTVECEGKTSSKFVKNVATGAEFVFDAKSEESKSCTDGGKAKIEGGGIVSSSKGLVTVS